MKRIRRNRGVVVVDLGLVARHSSLTLLDMFWAFFLESPPDLSIHLRSFCNQSRPPLHRIFSFVSALQPRSSLISRKHMIPVLTSLPRLLTPVVYPKNLDFARSSLPCSDNIPWVRHYQSPLLKRYMTLLRSAILSSCLSRLQQCARLPHLHPALRALPGHRY